MVRYLFYTVGDLTYQSPLVTILSAVPIHRNGRFPSVPPHMQEVRYCLVIVLYNNVM